MNRLNLKLTGVAVALTLGACSSPERSRNLNDANIAAATIAIQVCAACHGAQGVATSPNFPSLAAQPQPYLATQLAAFKDHSRADAPGEDYMWGLSAHLTEAQINGLADYYARLPAPAGNDQAGTPDQLKAGREIFEQGIAEKGVPACAACHGAHGEGADSFPRLAGQHAAYLMKQLQLYQNTDSRPAGVAMKSFVGNLTPENIADVAAYLESVSPGK